MTGTEAAIGACKNVAEDPLARVRGRVRVRA